MVLLQLEVHLVAGRVDEDLVGEDGAPPVGGGVVPVLDADQIAVIGVEIGAPQPEKVHHDVQGEVDAAVAGDGPAAEQLAGLLVHADAGVQVKDQDAAEAVKGDGAAALALSEADPQGHAVAGVCGAAVEQGGGHVEDASGPEGHGVGGQGQQLVVQGGKAHLLQSRGGGQQGQTHDQGAQQGAETLFQGAHLRFRLIRGL